MAGHSQFANIKHRKGAQDAKRAKLFTKIAKEIIVSVKTSGGQTDPNFNPRLRTAIIAARGVNMSNDKIQNAIKRGLGADATDNYEEIRYEGYGPGGIALIVEAMSDNRNRTASDIRSIFTKHGGALGETNSVAFMFERVGYIQYPADKASADAMFEAAIEVGADNCESSAHAHEITCSPDDFHAVREALAEKFGDAEASRLSWHPKTTTELDQEQAQKILNMVETLEDNDDVQHVIGNFVIPDAVAAKLE